MLSTAISTLSLHDALPICPVIATVLATAVWPPAGIILSMVTVGAGSLLLYIQKSTEPPPVERTTEAKGHVFSNPGIFAIIIVNIFLGVNFGEIGRASCRERDEKGAGAVGGSEQKTLVDGRCQST